MNVDWVRINSFITEGDEEEEAWLRDMIQTLIENYEERLTELAEITKLRDISKLVALLHQMKGITSNFGLEALRKITSEAESLAKANNLEASLAETAKLLPTWESTKVELKSKLGI
jgi:HPt (histidine-containing phosphotransfer) domain-containing protein